MKISLRFLLSAFLSIVLVAGLYGVALRWTANPETDLAGYKLHSGTTSGVYPTVADVGNVTETTFADQPGTTYYFALSAYDQDQFESPNSTEVSYTRPTPAPTATSTATVAPVPTATATATATATPAVSPSGSPIVVSGTILYCLNQLGVPGVTVTVTGSTTVSTTTGANGGYQVTLNSGGSYIITPTKPDVLLGSPGIDTADLIAVQRHYLQLGVPLTGCALAAADATGDTRVNAFDVIAIQKFFVRAIVPSQVGHYLFTPTARAYPGLGGTQAGQDYNVIVFGDVTAPFVEPNNTLIKGLR